MYGISPSILRWIEGFLTGRKQQVCVNGSVSKWADVSSGIPQGSVLGPILFVIYINDLPNEIKSDIYMFADDTKLFRTIKTNDDQCILQDDLGELTAWSIKWLLTFHPDKDAGFLLRMALAGTMAFIAGTTCPDRITVRHIAMVLIVINVIDTE